MSGLVWITGGAGFLGSHLAESLAANGARLSIVDDLSTGSLDNLAALQGGHEFHKLNLNSPDAAALLAAEKPSMIYHLAGDALVSRSVADPLADVDANLMPTLRLLESVRIHSPHSRVMFASTGAVYGESAASPFTEDDPLYPISPYAVAKLASERYCYAYARTFGLRTCSLRLFSIFGPRQRKQVVFDLIRKLHANPARLELFGDGSQERDFSHSSNVVDAFVLAAQHAEFAGEVINVAGNETVSIRELASIIADLMGAKPEFVFSGEKRPGDSQRWIADTSRLRHLGYYPGVSLRNGLRDTIDWYLRHPE